MGICETFHHQKNLENVVYRIKSDKIDQNDQTLDYQKWNQDETGSRPSIFNQTQIKNSFIEDKIYKEKPKLSEYDRSITNSRKSLENNLYSNNHISFYSSGKSETEVIVKGEINKEAKNKEEDFVNKSFKNLVKKNGGVIIKADDINNNLNKSITNRKPLQDLGFENISEIHSNRTSSIQNNDIKLGDSIKIINSNLNLSIIKGFNNNEIMSKKNNNNNDITKISIKHSNKLKESSKINISLHESCPKTESYLHLPKTDFPLPDISELSESRLTNSISSNK